MVLSPKEILKKSIARLFRSEDLKISISTLYSFFQAHIPLDFITLVVYDAKQHTVRYRAHSTDTNIIYVDELIKFSENTRKETQSIIDANEKLLYIPNGSKHPLVRQFDSAVGIDQPASIIMHPVAVAPHQYALLNLVVWGEDRYNQKNINLLNGLTGLIASAVRHIHSQLVIKRLQERLTFENRELRKKSEQNLIGINGSLRDVMLSIEQVAKLDTPILIMGETGVGKELVANTIHRRSRRAHGPLVSINCGAITETLLDSELFGHEKGAFTGANAIKKGFFEQADGGSIFLDEVSELSKQAQVKLLRVLQHMTLQRVGGQRTISIDVRVIAATNRDIAKMVENQEFRQDLWFRLNTFPISIPPLRNRKDDIPLLAEYFANCLSLEMNLPYRYRFAPHAMEQLQRYDWPGNVRELENIIEQALIVSRGAPLSFPYLDLISPKASSFISLKENNGRELTMKKVMSNHILNVLSLTHGRIEGRNGAAEILDMKPSTLRARIKKLGIHIDKKPDKI